MTQLSHLLAITLLLATIALVLAEPTRDELVADARKLSMKELRSRLESFSIACETCVEKKDYVRTVFLSKSWYFGVTIDT